VVLPQQGLYGSPRITPSCVTLLFQRKHLTDDNATVAEVLWLRMDTCRCNAIGSHWVNQAVPRRGHTRCGLVVGSQLAWGDGAASTNHCACPYLLVHAPVRYVRPPPHTPAGFRVVVKDPDTQKILSLPSHAPGMDDGVEETKGGDGPVPDPGPPSSPLPAPSAVADGAWLAG
jgi:hypothetical protein